MKKIFILLIISISIYAADTVKDTDTDLIWQDNYSVKNNSIDYNGAVKYCQNLSLSGYDDWRLPNIDELMSITDKSKYSPSIKKIFKNVKSSYYWTITKTKWSSSRAWIVYFDSGSDSSYKLSNEYCVRCVR